jgi:hypothetical protein
VDNAYVQDYKGDLFCLIKDYFEKSKDTSATPGAVMLDMVKNCGTSDYVLVVHETDNRPDSFMVGKLVGNVARIITAFLGKGLESKAIIKEFLDIFDGWAKEKNCVASDAYTHRHLKNYKALTDNGWKHLYSVYRKDYEGETK